MTPNWRWLFSGVATCGVVFAGAWAHATPAQVILIRHGDKDVPRGDYNLSPVGFIRALSLGRVIPACFGTPNQIRTFQLNPVSSKNSRSYQTAVPLAVATGVNIGIVMGSKTTSGSFGEDVLSSKTFDGAKAVFFWEHRHLLELAKGLGWTSVRPIDADDYDQVAVLTYPAGSKTPNVEILSQQELFQRPCAGQTPSAIPQAQQAAPQDSGAASAGLKLEMGPLYKAVGQPPKPQTAAADQDLAILLWLQNHRTPDQIAKSWLLLDRNIVQFDRALGIDMTKSTPAVVRGLTSFLKLVNGAKETIKDRVQRPRPYVTHPDIQVCLPPEASWSYPSGHSTFFRSAAILLADLIPERRDRLLAVGLYGGTSRNICGLHYPSDVDAGQRLGEAAALQILKSTQWQQFKQMPGVQKEIETIRQVPSSRLPLNDG